MSDEIVNRVAQSKLVLFDLEEWYPEGERREVDIRGWLEDGMILREKDFRTAVKEHDWSEFKDCYVAIKQLTDVIIPVWAYMLISTAITPYARKVVLGDLEDLEIAIYQDIISGLDTTIYKDKPLIIKGCAHKPVPSSAYVMAVEKLRPVARSIQFGEACSSVPLYKRK